MAKQVGLSLLTNCLLSRQGGMNLQDKRNKKTLINIIQYLIDEI